MSAAGTPVSVPFLSGFAGFVTLSSVFPIAVRT